MGGFFAQEAPELVELDIVPFLADAAALPVLDSAAASLRPRLSDSSETRHRRHPPRHHRA